MNPNTVFSASLITSLVLWFPSMQACLRGDLDLAPAGLRYVAALAVSRLALNGLARLVGGYRSAQAPPAPLAAIPADGSHTPPVTPDAAPHRRRTDPPTEADTDPASVAA